MDDLISREAAIDALMEILDEPSHAEFLYTDEICKALNGLPSVQPEWIPCSEKLPYAEYGESPNVYCYCYDPDLGGKWTQLLYYDGGVWCLPTGETFEYKVLAWYPLPTKPYKGDKDETD